METLETERKAERKESVVPPVDTDSSVSHNRLDYAKRTTSKRNNEEKVGLEDTDKVKAKRPSPVVLDLVGTEEYESEKQLETVLDEVIAENKES